MSKFTYLILLTLLSTVRVGARPPSAAVVTFTKPLTHDFLRLLESKLGFPCEDYVGPGRLHMYVDDEIRDILQAPPFKEILRRIVPINAVKLKGKSIKMIRERARGAFTVPQQPPQYGMFLNGTQRTPVSVHTTSTTDLVVHVHKSAIKRRGWPDVATALTDALPPSSNGFAWIDGTTAVIQRVPDADVEALADLLVLCPEVRSVDATLPVHSMNLWNVVATQGPPADTSVSAAQAAPLPYFTAGLDGTGQIVAVSDTGLTTGMCYFNDPGKSVPFHTAKVVPADTGHRKLRSYWSYGDAGDADGHGTHVAGSISGESESARGANGNFGPADFDGTAPGARLAFIDIEYQTSGLVVPYPYDTELFSYAYDVGARIHSGSWGIDDFAYTEEDRRADLFAWNNRYFVPIFSAGNSGAGGPNTIVSPALGKNVVAVGATQNGYAARNLAFGDSPSQPNSAYDRTWVADFSSRGGPSVVPWIKPDVLIGGAKWVWSAASTGVADCAQIGTNVIGYFGTSMACPTLAGEVALIRQYFLEGRHGSAATEPTAALVRAVLAAGARPAQGVFPQTGFGSFTGYGTYGDKEIQGHGVYSKRHIMPLPGDTRIAMHVLSNEDTAMTTAGQRESYSVLIGGSCTTALISVALVYVDYPTSTSVAPAIVNDLDVWIRQVGSSTVLYPNGLSGPDRNNPVEVIRTTLSPGDQVDIYVDAHGINYDQQTYGLLIGAEVTSGSPDVTLTVIGEAAPTPQPTPQPTSPPTPKPTAPPTAPPTPKPTAMPTAQPTPFPTEPPTPTNPPTAEPTEAPTPVPTTAPPTPAPPTPNPTQQPTAAPTPQPPPTSVLPAADSTTSRSQRFYTWKLPTPEPESSGGVSPMITWGAIIIAILNR